MTKIDKLTCLYLLGLFIFASCTGQDKTNTSKDPITSKSSPTVIKNFKAAAQSPDFDTTIVSQYIRSIFQDSKGNLWFGTIGEGVVRYDVKTLTYFSNPDVMKREARNNPKAAEPGKKAQERAAEKAKKAGEAAE